MLYSNHKVRSAELPALLPDSRRMQDFHAMRNCHCIYLCKDYFKKDTFIFQKMCKKNSSI